MTESEISKKLFKPIVEEYGKQSVFKLHGHASQAPGWPDIRLTLPGLCVWIETKGLATEVKLIQKIVLRHLRKCGDNAFVLRFLSPTVYLIEDPEGEVISACGGATWDRASESVVATLREICNGA